MLPHVSPNPVPQTDCRLGPQILFRSQRNKKLIQVDGQNKVRRISYEQMLVASHPLRVLYVAIRLIRSQCFSLYFEPE